MEKRTIKGSTVPIVEQADRYKINFKNFFCSLVVTFSTLFLMLGLFSYYSNFWGFFGSSGAWALYNDRQAKVDFLRQMEPAALPEAYILGSSDMFPFQPKQVEDKFKLRTYNLANYWGRMEEIWAWLNFLVNDLNAPPKLLVVGLEPWTFSVDSSGPALMNNYRRRFVATPDLVKYAPDFKPLRWQISKFVDLFSVNNIWLGALQLKSGELLKISERPTLEEAGVLEIDGTNVGYNKPRPENLFPSEVNEFYQNYAAGIINDPKEIKTKTAEILSKNYIRKDTILSRLPKDTLDYQDIDLFKEFVDLCEEYNTKLIIILPPVHPLHRDSLIEHTNYTSHINKILETLENLKKKHDNIEVIFNATDLRIFKGDPREFHDINHMTPVNANLILKYALEQIH